MIASNCSDIRFHLILAAVCAFTFCLGPPIHSQDVASTVSKSSQSERMDSRVVSRAMAMIQGNTPVIEELELLEFQLEQLKSLQYEMQRDLGKVAQTASKMSSSDRREQFDLLYADVAKQMESILLPRQFTRLMQISSQSFGINPANGQADLANLVGSPVAQMQLGLPATRVSELRAKMLDENKRVAEEIERIKAEARERVLAVLTVEERQKLDQLVGEPFDFKGFRPGRGGRFTNKEDH